LNALGVIIAEFVDACAFRALWHNPCRLNIATISSVENIQEAAGTIDFSLPDVVPTTSFSLVIGENGRSNSNSSSNSSREECD
jgi:hypothetical protein